MKRGYIVGAGTFEGFYSLRPGDEDYIIAADGGYRYLLQEQIEPDALLGDFDSLEIVPEHQNLIRHSPIKDDTDMALAAEYAIAQGCTELFLFGGLGGRMDHSIANMQLITGLSRRGITTYLVGEGIILTSICKEEIAFHSDAKGMISVFCLGEPAVHVYEKGLKYGLSDAVLTCDRALGVSNEFTGTASSISVAEGSLVISWDVKNGLPVRRERI